MESIERRTRQGIAIDERDIPVNAFYIDSVLAITNGRLIHKSKWFNAITISTDRPRLLEELENVSFVSGFEQVKMLESDLKTKELDVASALNKSNIPFRTEGNIYGEGFEQISMHNGHLLHAAGFDGKGVKIGVIDAGYSFADELPIFAKLRDEGRLHIGYDFVDGDQTLFHGSTHGTYVLSTMAGWLPDSLIGTAPLADYWLFRTEDVGSEFPVEEDNWVAAAEMADSIGIDVINSSLGYSIFDDESYNHSYIDMDGNTTRISRAANIASQKGILVVTSAGNSGDDAWHYITAPADADGIVTVGAVNSLKQHAWFSSYGPSYDGRVKPNVVAMGEQASFANLNGGIGQGNGTSFASPIMAGLLACFWQAHPELTVKEVIDRIERVSTHHYNYNDSLGYGIPDLWKAHEASSNWHLSNDEEFQIVAYPNPSHDGIINIICKETDLSEYQFKLFDINGREIVLSPDFIKTESVSFMKLDLKSDCGLKSGGGLYFLRIWNNENTEVIPIVLNY
jgi:subtilisin family serine protease